MIQFEIFESTRPWSRFTDFYIQHRRSIIPRYPVMLALRDVKNCMRQGRAAILVNEWDEVVGIGSFVLGLAEEGYQHKDIAVLGNSCFTEMYRNNRTFIRGLQVLAEQIQDANPNVQGDRIPPQAD